MLRLRSAESPFGDAVVAGQAARLLAMVESVGLWEPHVLIERLDRAVFVEALEAVAGAGVARYAPFDWENYAEKTPEDFARWIKTVSDDIADSPVPDRELPEARRPVRYRSAGCADRGRQLEPAALSGTRPRRE